MTDEPSLKPVIWIGSSRQDLRKFSDSVLGEAEQIARGMKP